MDQILSSISAITVANRPYGFVPAPVAGVNLATNIPPLPRFQLVRDSRSVNSRVSTLPMVRSSPSVARFARPKKNEYQSLNI
jgi:hypothetical protein